MVLKNVAKARNQLKRVAKNTWNIQVMFSVAFLNCTLIRGRIFGIYTARIIV